MPDISHTRAAKPRCIKLEHWPERDRLCWTTAHRHGRLLEDDGLAAS
jgi:hypothetical protein